MWNNITQTDSFGQTQPKYEIDLSLAKATLVRHVQVPDQEQCWSWILDCPELQIWTILFEEPNESVEHAFRYAEQILGQHLKEGLKRTKPRKRRQSTAALRSREVTTKVYYL